jgi:GNAT superfamily N-acetyltransferase
MEQVQFQQSKDWIDLSHVLKDDAGQIVAGINAILYCWNMMYVDNLFVESLDRGKGHGKLLPEKKEELAKNLDGYMSHLDTFDWQAKELYENLGYPIFGVLGNCPRGHKRYYMEKDFYKA